jgi:DNA-binding transcriptional MerR regulator
MRLIKIKEACNTTGLTRKQIMFYIKEGILAYANVGQGEKLARYRFSEKALEELIEKIQRTV